MNSVSGTVVGRPVILDTSLLLLLVVGSESPELIGKCKRLDKFGPADYDLLVEALSGFGCIVTTPNIATEVSNFGRQMKGSVADSWATRFRVIMERLPESAVPTSIVVQDDLCPAVGVTDVATAIAAERLADRRPLVLTTDFELFGLLQSRGIECQNFNHRRRWD